MNIISFHSPKYVSSDGKYIDCMVLFEGRTTELPFIASINDVEPHGVELYNRLLAGEAGVIEPYIAPIIPTLVPSNKITPLQFKARFDSSEWSNILTAVMSDPNVLGWVFEASAASYIDLTDPTTSLGLSYLSTRTPSLLSSDRISAILTP